jgi:hypothetical protein
MVVQVPKPDWCNEDGEAPAKSHGDDLYEEHDNGVNEEHVVAHDVANNALVDEARVWIQKAAYDADYDCADAKTAWPVAKLKENEGREDKPEQKIANIVLS